MRLFFVSMLILIAGSFISSPAITQDLVDTDYDSEEFHEPLLFEWKNVSVDSTIVAENLEFTFRSNISFRVKVVPKLECKGLLVKKATLELQELYLDPGQEFSFSIPAEQIPIQAEDGTSEISVTAHITSAEPNIAYSWLGAFVSAYYYHSVDSSCMVLMNTDGLSIWGGGSKAWRNRVGGRD